MGANTTTPCPWQTVPRGVVLGSAGAGARAALAEASPAICACQHSAGCCTTRCRGSDAFFWPLWVLRTRGVKAYVEEKHHLYAQSKNK